MAQSVTDLSCAVKLGTYYSESMEECSGSASGVELVLEEK